MRCWPVRGRRPAVANTGLRPRGGRRNATDASRPGGLSLVPGRERDFGPGQGEGCRGGSIGSWAGCGGPPRNSSMEEVFTAHASGGWTGWGAAPAPHSAPPAVVTGATGTAEAGSV